MADISKITITNGSTYDVRDRRVPEMTLSESTYLRGDGVWAVPPLTSIRVSFIDCGNYLLIQLP